jgi:BMFP domain-containing protein YqiC
MEARFLVAEPAMQTETRIFDDLAKVASGALHALGGVKDEIETRFRERLERLAAEMELVTREEVEAVRGMASKARMEQEALAARVSALETELAALKAAKATRSKAGPKAAEHGPEAEPDAS